METWMERGNFFFDFFSQRKLRWFRGLRFFMPASQRGWKKFHPVFHHSFHQKKGPWAELWMRFRHEGWSQRPQPNKFLYMQKRSFEARGSQSRSPRLLGELLREIFPVQWPVAVERTAAVGPRISLLAAGSLTAAGPRVSLLAADSHDAVGPRVSSFAADSITAAGPRVSLLAADSHDAAGPRVSLLAAECRLSAVAVKASDAEKGGRG